ncbi:MAG: two-component system chemotaxis response regulator CheY [Candidatus Latescibacterota bacterium]|jgi:two-component system chemotaxis response regulator CheY
MELYIVCVDDQREVLAALQNDLAPLPFGVEGCESAGEAWEVIDDLDASGKHLALIICDQVMPEKSGVAFLTEVTLDDRFLHTRKLLLTGLATHSDTIRAINESNIDMYVEKPWDVEKLLDHIRRLVTEYVVAAGVDYTSFMNDLHPETLYKALRKKT